jgi:hypothetical protein
VKTRLSTDRRFQVAAVVLWTLVAVGLGSAASAGSERVVERVVEATPRVVVVTPPPVPAPTPQVVTREVVPAICDETIVGLLDGYAKALKAFDALLADDPTDPAFQEFMDSIDDSTREALLAKARECLAYPRG